MPDSQQSPDVTLGTGDVLATGPLHADWQAGDLIASRRLDGERALLDIGEGIVRVVSEADYLALEAVTKRRGTMRQTQGADMLDSGLSNT